MEPIMKETTKRKLRALALELVVILAIAGALTLASIARAEAREIVCMPSVEQPAPGDETRKVPTRYSF